MQHYGPIDLLTKKQSAHSKLISLIYWYFLNKLLWNTSFFINLPHSVHHLLYDLLNCSVIFHAHYSQYDFLHHFAVQSTHFSPSDLFVLSVIQSTFCSTFPILSLYVDPWPHFPSFRQESLFQFWEIIPKADEATNSCSFRSYSVHLSPLPRFFKESFTECRGLKHFRFLFGHLVSDAILFPGASSFSVRLGFEKYRASLFIKSPLYVDVSDACATAFRQVSTYVS